MAKPSMDLTAFIGKLLEEQDGDILREGIRVLAQALMEAEVAGLLGAERHERTEDRTGYRNGSRVRTWDTRVGTIQLEIPKVRPGTYFPSLLQPRRRAEHALLAVVQEAYVHGVSTRKVDELLRALGLDGVSKSEVSRICSELDPLVEAFRTRSLSAEYPYVWLDATYHKVRLDGRVISQATVVAIGVTTDGERQVLGVDVGPSEEQAFWTTFLRSLVKRGLRGVRLVISDAHEGLKAAIGTVLTGATWQRCRVHFMRNLLATLPHVAREPIAAIVRTIFAQPRSRHRDGAAPPGGRRAAQEVPADGDAARGGGGGHPGVSPVSLCPPTATALDQSPRAAEQGDQTPVERRGDLPDGAVVAPPGGGDSDRARR